MYRTPNSWCKANQKGEGKPVPNKREPGSLRSPRHHGQEQIEPYQDYMDHTSCVVGTWEYASCMHESLFSNQT